MQHRWFQIKDDKKKELALAETPVVSGALKNLLHFRADSKAKIAIYSYFSSELLSKAELNVITSVFKQLDQDGDGILDYEELVKSY